MSTGKISARRKSRRALIDAFGEAVAARANSIPRKPPITPAEINRLNIEFWEARTPQVELDPLAAIRAEALRLTLRAATEEERGRVKKRSQPAVMAKKKKTNEVKAAIRAEAGALLTRNPKLSRQSLAERVATRLKTRSQDTVLKHLRSMNLPPKK